MLKAWEQRGRAVQRLAFDRGLPHLPIVFGLSQRGGAPAT